MKNVPCYIKFKNEHFKIIDFLNLKSQDYDKVEQIIFHDLSSKDIELYSPNLYNLINLEKISVNDNMQTEFSNKIANLKKLKNICSNNFSNFYPLHTSKLYEYENNAMITNYKKNMVLNKKITNLNIFIGHIDNLNNIANLDVVFFLNNLDNKIEYLQINMSDYNILEYIYTLPFSLKKFDVSIVNFYETPNKYDTEYINKTKEFMNKIKIPFGCISELNFY